MGEELECRTGIEELLCLEKMQLSEDAQGILQPRRRFCDLSKRENLLPSAVLGSNTRLHSGAGETMCLPFCRTGDHRCSVLPAGLGSQWMCTGQ